MEKSTDHNAAVTVSIGIFAWNEEDAIVSTLQSLLQQSVFPRLAARGEVSEVICVLNGCTDQTPRIARDFFVRQTHEHPAASAFRARVEELPEKGKMNAWNTFVHQLSAGTATVLFMMDADILIHQPDTLWNMLVTLEQDREAAVAVDLPVKLVPGQSRVGIRKSLSSGMTQMTRALEAQLCGQLYAIRSETARGIYVPKDLGACEDGYLKSMVCTDLLSHGVWPRRIRLAPDAAHTFEAYTSVQAILKNQKRQIIGQTIVHLLVDKYLKALSLEKQAFAPFLRAKDKNDPNWLKRLISSHVRETRFFWQLYPGLLRQHFVRLRNVSRARKLACWPAALAGVMVALISSFMAFRSFKSGAINYWPKAQRIGLKPSPPALSASIGANH